MSLRKMTPGRLVFVIINTSVLILLAAVTLYPFLYVAAASVSNPSFIIQGKVSILPVGFTLDAYRRVIEYPMIGRSYMNTIGYTALGTTINMLLTVCGAYPLSRKRFPGKNFFVFMIAFTMLFSGGLIPTYLVYKILE